jgi:hypothetical protein
MATLPLHPPSAGVLLATVGEDAMLCVSRLLRGGAGVRLEVLRVARVGAGTPTGVAWVHKPDSYFDGRDAAAVVVTCYDSAYLTLLPLQLAHAKAP